MTTPLTAALELRNEPILGSSIGVRFSVRNDADDEIVLTNPDVGLPPPGLGWKASNEAYQIGVLISFGLLEVKLKDDRAETVKSKGLMPWVTPILSKRVLSTNDQLIINFDINELFLIEAAGKYNLAVKFADQSAIAQAALSFELRSA
ncbi:MAG TPA: hypothetical protein VHQ95_16205 [Pyrinomonadaceae bacterium]|jgi:hypothetical protein|nr:hypothetical protein [Pyrinomonadaceae bacterium]